MITTGLTIDELATLFPFYLAVDRDLRIVQRGASLAKIMPELAVGADLPAHFTLTRPRGEITYAALRELGRTTCALAARAHALVLKGQLITRDSMDTLLFLGSPRVTSATELTELGLTIGDFAVHDAILDFLFLSHAQQSALDEVRAMAHRLAEQRQQVRDAHDRMTTLYTASRVLADSPTLEAALRALVPALARALGCAAGSAWLRRGDELACFTSHPPTPDVPPLRLGRSRGMIAGVFATGEPMWLPAGFGGDDGLLGATLARGEPIAAPAAPPRAPPADALDPPTVRYAGEGAPASAVCGLPIKVGGEVLGVIALATPTTLRRPDDLLYLLGEVATKLEQFTASRRAAEEIASREAVLAAIMATVPLGLCVVEGSDVLYANPQFWRLWGVDAGRHAPNGRLDGPLHDALAAHIAPAHQALLAPGDGVREADVPLRDGRTLRLHTAPLDHVASVDADLAAPPRAGRLYLVEDITERERTRSQLAAQSAELATARDAALASVRAKTEFLANVSHELRTPLGSVIGMASVLRTMALPDGAGGVIDDIETAGQTLLRLVEDLLDEARISAGKLAMEEAPFDLVALVRSTTTALQATAARRGLHLLLEIPPATRGDVVGDRVRLGQVLTNLIGNAIKFTDLGSVRVRLGVDDAPDDRARVTIEVIDTGIGIGADQLERVFEPFTQVDGSTTRRHGGAGLGLTISRRLVTLMGGTLGVRSAPGEGSTFTIALQLARPRVTPAATPAAREAASRALAPRRRRVLVVEDNPLGQRATRMLLEQLGQDVAIVGDGAAAVDAIAREAFDLVLMDCHLPVLDGFEATRRIRGIAGPGARVPIVACTASVLIEDRRRCFEVGMDDVLLKPLAPAELRRVLHATDEGTPAPSAAPAEMAPAPPPPAREAPPALLDPERIAMLRGLVDGSGRSALGSMLDLYRAHAPQHLSALSTAASAGDLRAVQRAAHALRGMSANVGASAVAAACAELERRAAAGTPAILDDLQHAYRDTVAALAALPA